MKILIIMDPGILIPVKGYGGHERLVEMFAKEYQRLGHDVHLLISSGSTVEGCTVHNFGKEGFPPKKSDALKAIPVAWKFLWSHRNDFDLVHNFGRLVYLLPVLRHPIHKIMTYGREINTRNIRLFNAFNGKNIVFTACSANLLSRADAPAVWEVIYNAIDFLKYNLTEVLPQDAPLIFLGRIEKVKGCHTAIRVAKATGHNLIIAGNISPLPEEKIYFEQEIEPYIDGTQIRYVGAMDDKQKNEYLGKARALLFPIEWNEPFGIVMIEAMACGTPVIAFNRGSVAEVIDEGITGIMVSDLCEMTQAVERLSQVDRAKCRAQALSRFDVRKIAPQYLNLFSHENKVVIISTGQPSANPRVVKEATALSYCGYKVSVIYCPMSPWANEFDKLLFARTPAIKWIKTGYSIEEDFWKYNFSRLRRKFYELFNKFFPFIFRSKVEGMFLFSPDLKRKAKINRANLYIAHYLGALPAAIAAGKKHNAAVIFDAEDFHRGEEPGFREQKKYIIETEDRYLPKVNSLITASPLISAAYKKFYPHQTIVTINNVFSKINIREIRQTEKELKLFWFSQNIGAHRGLENIIKAMNLLHGEVSLHLLGNIRDKMYFQSLITTSTCPEKIHLLNPVPPEQVFKIASQFDIGIAAEIPHSENRNICLTNKIFTYLVAGNCVLASNTDAQKDFMDRHPGIGLLYDYNQPADMASKIQALYDDRDLLQSCKINGSNLAKSEMNWENESLKLLSLVKTVMQKN